jgi:hypothetical protein
MKTLIISDVACPHPQVVTIFFGTFIAGSFLNQVQLFISDPTSVVRILGAAAPQTATFFMSYLLLLGLTTKPFLFLRLPGALPRPGPRSFKKVRL